MTNTVQLTQCYYCGGKVSSAAGSCVHCGLRTTAYLCSICGKAIETSSQLREWHGQAHADCLEEIRALPNNCELCGTEISLRSLENLVEGTTDNYSYYKSMHRKPCSKCGHPLYIVRCRYCAVPLVGSGGIKKSIKEGEYEYEDRYFHKPCLEKWDIAHPNSVCFIATAVYGSPYAPDVTILRTFRDLWLMRRRMGRAFVSMYETVGPSLAARIERSELLRFTARMVVVKPAVWLVKQVYRQNR